MELAPSSAPLKRPVRKLAPRREEVFLYSCSRRSGNKTCGPRILSQNPSLAGLLLEFFCHFRKDFSSSLLLLSKKLLEPPHHLLLQLALELVSLLLCDEALLHLCSRSPVVSTSLQPLNFHVRELLSHRSLVLAGRCDEKTQCLFNRGRSFLGSRGRPWSTFTEFSCEVEEACVWWEKLVARGEKRSSLTKPENERGTHTARAPHRLAAPPLACFLTLIFLSWLPRDLSACCSPSPPEKKVRWSESFIVFYELL